MTNIVISGLIEKENNFLLVQEAKEKCKGKWNIPAGHLEVNESVIDCLKRDIKELKKYCYFGAYLLESEHYMEVFACL